MTLYKRGNVWWYDFRFKGKRISRSTRQANKAVARQIEAAHRTRLAKGEVGIHEPKPVPTFEDFSKSFLSHIKSVHEAKPKTVAYYQTGLTRLKDFDLMKKLPLDQIDKAVIDAYVEKRKGEKKSNGKPFKVASINRHLEVLRRMLRLANEWKIISIVPRIRRLPGEEGRDRVITHAEEIAYLASADEPLRTIATVLVDTGMRPEEAFRMTWENVYFKPAGDAQYGRIYNPFGKSKNAKRNIPMTQRVKALLEMRWEAAKKPTGGWVFPADTKAGHVVSLKSQHKRAFKRSAVAVWFVLYALRHTMLTRLGESGADAFTIQKIAGHSDIRVSQRYVHPTPERVEKAFASLQAYNAALEKAAMEEKAKAASAMVQ